MEVACTEKQNIILFFIYSNDKFLALLLLNPLKKILESPQMFVHLNILGYNFFLGNT